jgi:hypothetical protein
MDHVSRSLGAIFKKPYVEDEPNTKLGDHGTPNAHNRLSCMGTRMTKKLIEIAFG